MKLILLAASVEAVSDANSEIGWDRVGCCMFMKAGSKLSKCGEVWWCEVLRKQTTTNPTHQDCPTRFRHSLTGYCCNEISLGIQKQSGDADRRLTRKLLQPVQ